MTGLVFSWDEVFHQGRIANDDDDQWFQVKRSDVLGGFDLAEGDRVIFEEGPEIVTKRNAKIIRSAINVEIISMMGTK